MKVPEETPESELSRQQVATRERLLIFMEELTQLCQRHGIYISSEGDIDVPSLRMINGDPKKYHYVPFWRDQFSYPMDIFFEERVDPHLIDI